MEGALWRCESIIHTHRDWLLLDAVHNKTPVQNQRMCTKKCWVVLTQQAVFCFNPMFVCPYLTHSWVKTTQYCIVLININGNDIVVWMQHHTLSGHKPWWHWVFKSTTSTTHRASVCNASVLLFSPETRMLMDGWWMLDGRMEKGQCSSKVRCEMPTMPALPFACARLFPSSASVSHGLSPALSGREPVPSPRGPFWCSPRRAP